MKKFRIWTSTGEPKTILGTSLTAEKNEAGELVITIGQKGKKALIITGAAGCTSEMEDKKSV